MEGTQSAQTTTYWHTAPELPPEVFAAWRKPDLALNPAAIVTTVDPDGAPRIAPFGSVQAVTSRAAIDVEQVDGAIASILPGSSILANGQAIIVCLGQYAAVMFCI